MSKGKKSNVKDKFQSSVERAMQTLEQNKNIKGILLVVSGSNEGATAIHWPENDKGAQQSLVTALDRGVRELEKISSSHKKKQCESSYSKIERSDIFEEILKAALIKAVLSDD